MKARPSPSSTERGASRTPGPPALPLAILAFGQQADRLSAFRWLASPVPVTWSLPQQIASTIGDRILADVPPPGAWLREQDLADEFQVSRGPIRAAFQILQAEGLVHVHARRGAQVTQLAATEVRDIFQIRASLFQLVARLLATQRDPAYLAALEEAIRKLEELTGAQASADEYARTVFRLSLYSASACGNERLRNILTALSLQTFRYSRLGLAEPSRRKRSLALWKATLAAVRAGDAVRAADVAAQRVAENGAAAERKLMALPMRKTHENT